MTPPRILAIANQKGGVGKTTTTINLGTALAAIGEKVLIIDLDPQGNASTGLGVEHARRRLTTYDVLRGEAELSDIAQETLVPGLTVAPSGVDLAAAEVELINAEGRHHRLRRAIERVSQNGTGPSYVLIDCPPSLGMLTVNAMAAAGIVSLPGMMTGQILAGSPPVEAVKYQIMILFLIAGGTGFGVLCAVWLTSQRLFDERHRLRLERLR